MESSTQMKAKNVGMLTIMVSTCKAYEDVMLNWLALYSKLNSHLNLNIYIVTDGFMEGIPSSVKQIIHESNDWQKRLSYAINQVQSKYIMLFLEDYYFVDRVNLDKFNLLSEFVVDKDISYCRMTNIPRQRLAGNLTSPLDFSKRHAINLQLAIWDKSFLNSILSSGSAWQLEDNLNQLPLETLDLDKFVIDSSSIIKLTNGIIKGKIDPQVSLFYEKEYSFSLNYKDRESLTWLDSVIIYLKSKGRYVKNKKVRVFLKKVIGLLGVNFVTKD